MYPDAVEDVFTAPVFDTGDLRVALEATFDLLDELYASSGLVTEDDILAVVAVQQDLQILRQRIVSQAPEGLTPSALLVRAEMAHDHVWDMSLWRDHLENLGGKTIVTKFITWGNVMYWALYGIPKSD